MKKRYWKISVGKNGWVSSSFHHHVRVTMVEGCYQVQRIFLIDAQSFLQTDGNGYLNRPRYVINEVLLQLRKLIESGQFRFCEYDRNGKARWENLRYYDPEVVAKMMASWPVENEPA